MNEVFVSVIMPVYNSEAFLCKAIESILHQTHSNFELIIINDGSTDSSSKIINKYATNDSRIRVIERENKGIIFSLNEAIKECKYDYIARMDSDDISIENRIELQLSYLLKNKNVAVLGSKASLIDEHDNEIGTTTALSSDYLLKAALLYGPVFTHPTVMFNRKLIKDDLYYNRDAYLAEDYDLWLRLSLKYKLCNLNDVLLNYRVNSNGVSQSNKKRQIESQLNICERFYLKGKLGGGKEMIYKIHEFKSVIDYLTSNLYIVFLIGFDRYSIARMVFVFKNTLKYILFSRSWFK